MIYRLRHRAEELLSHHRRRLEDTMAAVEGRPGMTAYEVAGAMRWQIRCRGWADFPLTQKFFAVGEAMSHLDYLRCRGRIEMTEQNGKLVWHALPAPQEPSGSQA